MKGNITCFISAADDNSLRFTINSLKISGEVDKIYVVGSGNATPSIKKTGTGFIRSKRFSSTRSLKKMAGLIKTDYVLLYTKSFPLDPGKYADQQTPE
jgi:hypothetical protein